MPNDIFQISFLMKCKNSKREPEKNVLFSDLLKKKSKKKKNHTETETTPVEFKTRLISESYEHLIVVGSQ